MCTKLYWEIVAVGTRVSPRPPPAQMRLPTLGGI
jgi:hypothetical protein